MTIVADIYPYVVGVDTHTRSHTFAILSRGRLVDTQTFPTNQAGLARAVDWIGRLTAGEVSDTVVSAEGTSSYGARCVVVLVGLAEQFAEKPHDDPFVTSGDLSGSAQVVKGALDDAERRGAANKPWTNS